MMVPGSVIDLSCRRWIPQVTLPVRELWIRGTAMATLWAGAV